MVIEPYNERQAVKRILLAVGEPSTTLQIARQIRPWLRERKTSLTLLAVISLPVSPVSHIKHVLEQVEVVFTDASEKPGIVLRKGTDPAAEICRETHAGGYDLVAIGLRDHVSEGSTIGHTCQGVLYGCSASVFVSPPQVHTGITPQLILAVDAHLPTQSMTDWLIAQCHAQKLNVILLASSSVTGEVVADSLARSGVRVQVIVQPNWSADDVAALGLDRRVHWIVLPVDSSRPPGGDALAKALLTRATCPVLLTPGRAARE